MIEQYEVYCLADRHFYERLDRSQAEHADFEICARPLPDGWEHQGTDTWMHYAPPGEAVRPQGWKVHISARIDDAERALAIVWDYCTAHRIPFKYLRSRSVMVMFNAKSAFRGSSGKLVTIYPPDESRLEPIVRELDELLAGVQGPYILSDLRYGAGPVFVRYGGFTERHCLGDNGERVLAIEDQDGNLVPDVRGATFALPPWVSLPAFLEPHLAARNAVTTEGLPYRIESVLQFSNSGGVYLGRDLRTQQQVVLKEGRPFAGLDVADRDAITRLAHERDILQRLAGLDVVPKLVDYFTLGDHQFLVQEFIDGNPLQRLMVQRYPLTRADCSAESIAAYTEWALEMVERVAEAVRLLHGRGVVFGDLHPDNILVTADGRVVLIDFEVSTLAADEARSALAHPGYGAPRDRQGVQVDEYALACLRIGLFAPQTTIMLPVHRAKAAHLADLVTATFPLPSGALDETVATIIGASAEDLGVPLADLPMPAADPGSWSAVRDAMRTAILAAATPERHDRLFPGDIAQFEPGGGINLAYGAAGVLLALSAVGAEPVSEHEDWLRKRALDPPAGTGPGFYDGLHGVAYALHALGHQQDALDALDICLRDQWQHLGQDLFSGLAGSALNLLHFGTVTGERNFTEQGLRMAELCAERLGGVDDVPELSGGTNPRAGLLFGSSGSALLFLRAFEVTRDPAFLDRAAVALRQDLRRCVPGEDGSLQVNQGWRTLPYLDEGSIGIALVLERYLRHRPDEEFATALRSAGLVARSRYFVQSGLFTGRAGIIAAQGTGLRPDDPGAAPAADTAEQIERLSLHALPYGGGLAFPGNQLMRLSMDFATGTAGVLFAVGTVLHDRPVSLPFLESPGTAVDRGSSDRPVPTSNEGR